MRKNVTCRTLLRQTRRGKEEAWGAHGRLYLGPQISGCVFVAAVVNATIDYCAMSCLRHRFKRYRPTPGR
eukprot:20996-Eustigmatos_ZCMA.PRE.1